MSGLKPYPAYKDSGVEWLGELPVSWNRTKLKWECRLRAGGTPESTNESFWLRGDDPEGIPFVSIGDMSQRDRVYGAEKSLSPEGFTQRNLPLGKPGTVLIAMYASVGEVSTLEIEATWNQALISVEPTGESLDRRFVSYFLRAAREDLLKDVRSNTQANLNATQIADVWVPLPPSESQWAIADFLDRETAEIDEFVAESDKLITLLNERRAAVITQAVTKGLDPTAPMKDTGIEGADQVPSHWRVVRISWLFKETASGTTPDSGEMLPGNEAKIPWVTSGELREANLTSTSKGVSAETLTRYSALTVHPPGSLLIAMYGATIGRMCILGVAAASNQAVCALRQPLEADVNFILFALLAAKERLLLESAGGGQPNINQDKVRAFRIPAPGLAEQTAIAKSIGRRTAKIDEAIATAREAIALAKERRQALISAAVTGKIDVRSAP